jgi:hypothetical protein
MSMIDTRAFFERFPYATVEVFQTVDGSEMKIAEEAIVHVEGDL